MRTNSLKKILFLGYGPNETSLIYELSMLGYKIIHHAEELYKIIPIPDVDLIVSFGYRHIISAEELRRIDKKIINLHISYLPWNRGAHPNFWAFYDSTPKGVTIHLIDQGIDSGPIIFQKFVKFNESENTFRSTYLRLKSEIENLFLKNLDILLSGKYSITPQQDSGTVHFIKDLPPNFLGWDADISDEIHRLKNTNKI